MKQIIKLVLPLILLLPGLANAADPVQESRCYGAQVTRQENWSSDGESAEYIYRGVARMLSWTRNYDDDGGFMVPQGFRFLRQQLFSSPYRRWGDCVYGSGADGDRDKQCGGPDQDQQLCWSLEPFTSANTSGGETCTSTIREQGIIVRRDQTVYAISIDRGQDPTAYCQIQFKTLETGDDFDSAPPGTGTTEVWEFAGDPDTPDIVPDEPIIDVLPDFIPATAVPFLPHFLLLSLTALLAALGVRRVRRKKLG